MFVLLETKLFFSFGFVYLNSKCESSVQFTFVKVTRGYYHHECKGNECECVYFSELD
jgi:hypothetical protein